MPAALDVDWEAIKLCKVAGVTYDVLATKFGIGEAAIRKRAQREHWPDPHRLRRSAHKIARKQAITKAMGATSTPVLTNENEGEKRVTSVLDVRFEGVLPKTSGEIATVTVSDNLLDIGTEGTLIAAQKALRSIKVAPENLPILGLSDLQTALKVVRLAAGMDKQEATSVQIGVFAGGVGLSGLSRDVTGDFVTGDEDTGTGD